MGINDFKDHDVYKQRGQMNRAIGLILFGIVVLIAVGSVAKYISETNAIRDNAADENVEISDVDEGNDG